MSIIKVNQLSKEYRRYKRYDGFLGALRTLVTKEYSTVHAVNNLSFDIKAGETIGYLGPNGAGKSTMIKMLTGILVPTSGEVKVRGTVPHLNRKENAGKIGVVFGQRSQLWWELPVIDSFDVHRHVYKIEESTYKQNLEFCIELLDLQPFLNSPVRQLSLGQRMRAEITLALLHDPDILFLDEPTIGLDVLAKDSIRDFLSEVNKEKNTTIFLTTHDLQDIEEICSRMLIVNKGDLIYDGDSSSLRRQLGDLRKMRIEFSEDPGQIYIPGILQKTEKGKVKDFVIEKETTNVLEVITEISSRYHIVDLSIEEANIEDIIRRFYQEIAREEQLTGSGQR